MKPLPPGDPDLRSHPMRSKLLSLSLVQSVLQASPHVLATDAWPLFARGGGEDRTMVQAVKQYLCVGLARNLASAVPQVYDASLDIFVRVAASSVRGSLKKELSVLFTELLLPILESKPPTSVTYHQRLSLLRHLGRLLSSPEGPRLLVEIYLNYDCDPEASGRENVWERMVSALARVVNRTESGAAGTPTSSTPTDKRPPGSGEQAFISTQHLAQLSKTEVSQLYSSKGDAAELRRRALEVLVTGVLGGLAEWVRSRRAEEDAREAESGGPGTPRAGAEDDEEPAAGQPPAADVPSVFEQSMRRKMLAQEGVRRFNWKPKKGVGMLLETGMVPSSDPKEIARFLLRAEGVDKRVLGEYLGEGDEEHIAIMHAFVDGMEFAGMRFVDALREFLQSFRLPGEAQKIDRFMLKFAERYLANNPGKFGSADTAYVLAYSVVMLNTDLHNPQIKKHMTKQEFIRNNRGIDEGKDLDQDFLETIYDEIASNEIRMKEEHENKPAAPEPPALGLDLLSLVPVARKRAPAPSLASEQMAQKTEGVLFKLLRGRKKKAAAVLAESASRNSIEAVGDRAGVSNVWFRASHHEHVRGMFEVVWMPVLTAVSGPLQETEDPDQLQLCLEGLRLSIRLSCEFPEMELERRAFVSTLSRFTQLANLGEIRPKNIEAIKLLLEIALAEGNFLGESWRDVAACISQLDRLALLGGGGAGDEGIKRIMSRSSISAGSGDAKAGKAVLEKAALETATPDMTVAIDRIFSGSVQLSGSAINDFYRALCAVSWDEIQSSSSWEHPRMYSLQRLVEMSYYNMNRIRMEWTNLWAILGDHLNQVGCHPNPNVGFFAIDKLHQLAMKFMDLDELPYFKFQKDFLRPYDYILGNNPDQGIKDMVLRCIHQLIQSKSRNMKSGWRTVFSALSRAGRDKSESVVNYSFEIVRALHTSFFDTVVANQAAPELINSLVEFCKNPRYEKISLQATEILKATVPRIADIAVAESARVRRIWEEEQAAGGEAETATATKQRKEDPMLKYWFPILFGLYEIVMTCELEVRTRALNYLFETLREYGGTFQQDFWEVVCRGVLFPIFDDLRMSKSETTKFGNREDMSIWLSTTLIKALHEFVALFDVFYEPLSFMMDGLLDLLALCVTQENEALARIGAGCIQQFVETNAAKFDAEAWDKVCGAFGRLFQATTPAGLFQLREQAMTFAPGLPLDRNIREEEGSKGLEQQSLKPGQSTSEQQQPDTPPESPEDLPVGGTGPASTQERPPISKKEFQQTISKCVIQLLLIQTLHETLTRNPVVYGNIPTASYLALLDCFERSFQFAKRFNNDLELRLALYRAGYMQQLPNLLKQETTAASCYAAGLLKIFVDSGRGAAMQAMVEQRVAPLASDIFEQFNGFDPETKKRNIAAWKPVIVMFLNSIALFDDEQFARHIPVFYTLFVNTLLRDITPDIRQALHAVLLRVGDYIFGKE
ncbi:hypothetical protein DFJ74DRAFT_654753 [Hyaloraphidium curvatum]|nr:hypothetical protein DFJ74DRAFT_654753 [Hyaloraphidium curvatum]